MVIKGRRGVYGSRTFPQSALGSHMGNAPKIWEFKSEYRNSTHVWVGVWSSLENRALLGKPSV